MAAKYLVDLTVSEHLMLLNMLKKGKGSARKVTRAHILLQAAEGANDEEIAHALRTGSATVHRIRQRFVEEGLEAALSERPRCGCRSKLDGRQEAFLSALACSAPPAGRERWTMQLLADRLVELTPVAPISEDTGRRILKKTLSSRGSAKSGVFPA